MSTSTPLAMSHSVVCIQGPFRVWFYEHRLIRRTYYATERQARDAMKRWLVRASRRAILEELG